MWTLVWTLLIYLYFFAAALRHNEDFRDVSPVTLRLHQCDRPACAPIWLYWDNGWQHAPYLVRAVAKSWQIHNPTHPVMLLSRDNLHTYVNASFIYNPVVSVQAKSDIIRLH